MSQELARVLRHFAPVLAAYVIYRFGLPKELSADLTMLFGELSGAVAVAIGAAVGYVLSLFRDKKRAAK